MADCKSSMLKPIIYTHSQNIVLHVSSKQNQTNARSLHFGDDVLFSFAFCSGPLTYTFMYPDIKVSCSLFLSNGKCLKSFSKLSFAVFLPTLLWLCLVLGEHVAGHVLWDFTCLLLSHYLRPPAPSLIWAMRISNSVLLG